MLVVTSIAAFAEDRNTYVSNVEHYGDRVVVTVTAKESALRQYPNGFMVGVRPANHLFDLFGLRRQYDSQKKILLKQ